VNRVLVTGARGFVGSSLVRHLEHRGAEVHRLSREELYDHDRLIAALREARPDHVFHLAGSPLVAGVGGTEVEAVEANVIGAFGLLDACVEARIPSVTLTGDAFEYGPSTTALREEQICRPTSVHGLTKLAATTRGQEVARSAACAVTTVRLFSVYGPGDRPQRLVPRLLAAARTGETVELSDPAIVRDWVHIDDIVELYWQVAQHAETCSGLVINAGSGIATSLGAVVETVEKVAGARVGVTWGAYPTAAHDLGHWIADPSLAAAELGWRATTSLDEGIAAMWAAA